MKKLLCAMLILTMLVTTAIPAFAAVTQTSVGYSDRNVEADGVYDQIKAGLESDASADEVSIDGGAEKAVNIKKLLNGDVVDEELLGADGAKYFYVTDVEGMKAFSSVVSQGNNAAPASNIFSFSGKTVYLMNDIDFAVYENNEITSYETMLPIGDAGLHETSGVAGDYGNQIDKYATCYEYFSGTFDGRGHSIKNLKMTSAYVNKYAQGNAVALFKAVRGAVTIKNLVIDSSCSFENKTSANTSGNIVAAGQGNIAASLIGYAYAWGESAGFTVTNVASYATVECGTVKANKMTVVERYDIAAGLIGSIHSNKSSTASNCTFGGKIIQAGSSAGGILGVISCAGGGVTVADSLNSGIINGSKYAGGIIGSDYASTAGSNSYSAYVRNCVNTGKIVGAEASGAFVGHQAQTVKKIQVTKSLNNGEVSEVGPMTNSDTVASTYTNTYTAAPSERLGVVGVQPAVNKTANGDKEYRSYRVIGSISATESELGDYQSVGFKITALYGNGGKVLDGVEETVVYTSILETSYGVSNEIAAEDGTYYFVAVMDALPCDIGTVNCVITPYYTAADGTVAYGRTVTVAMNIAAGTAE